MAIDGTNIIDSDLANDIDAEFMNLYDSGKSVNTIKSEIERWRAHLCDNVEEEIFITTYAFDLWQIGELTGDILTEAKETIAKVAGVNMFLEESGKTAATARAEELERFIAMISAPPSRIRARKKTKKLKDFVFQIDDALTFLSPDGYYCAFLLVNVKQSRGDCSYVFTPTLYKSHVKPTIADILATDVIGRRIPCGFSVEEILTQQPGIERFWAPNSGKQFILGIAQTGVGHSDLVKFRSKFEVIGKVPILPGFKQVSSYGAASTFYRFQTIFTPVPEEQMSARGIEFIPLSHIMAPSGAGF